MANMTTDYDVADEVRLLIQDCRDENFTNSSMYVPPPMDISPFDHCFYTNRDPGMFHKPWTEDTFFWPTVLTYTITFVLGVTGNILVIFALTCDKKARNVTSSFLVSLAVSDLMFLLICVPYDIAVDVNVYWVGGPALCKIAGFVEILTASASILNLTAVSVERYAVIVHPMKSRSWCTMGNTTKIILGVWVVASLFSSPLLHIRDTELSLYYSNASYVTTHLCSDAGLGGSAAWIGFAWYQLIVMFLVPMVVMVFCYAVVIQVLWMSTKQLASMTNTKSSREEDKKLTSTRDRNAEITDARKQVIRMLLAIIAAFFICWGPKLVFNVMKKHEANIHTNLAYYADKIIGLLPYIQSCTNPIIYSFMSKNFRRSMRMACKFNCRCCSGSMPKRKHRRVEFDMDTKSGNGVSGKFSPSMTTKSLATSYSTVLSDN